MNSPASPNDLSAAPVSRRAVAAGIWAAPVIALVATAPAYAASGTPTLSVTASGSGSNRVWTVSFEFLPAGTTVVVRSNTTNKTVQFQSGAGLVATPTGATQQFTVSGATSGTFTFIGQSSPAGTVTAGSLSQNFS